jgi:hypothetical protein
MYMAPQLDSVHCHTGSLEDNFSTVVMCRIVHCRTGSLEGTGNLEGDSNDDFADEGVIKNQPAGWFLTSAIVLN